VVLQEVLRRGKSADREARCIQQAAQRLQNGRIVIDDADARCGVEQNNLLRAQATPI